MMEPEEQILQELLQQLTCYFTKFRIHEGIVETQLAKIDPAEEENEERQKVQNEAAMAKKKPNFEV